MRMMLSVAVLAAAALGALVWVLSVPAMAEAPRRDIAAGAAIYVETCAACHGAALEGQADWQRPGPDGILPAPPHDETGHTWHHGDGMLFDYVALGGAAALEARGVTGFASGMPGFSGVLEDAEIRDVLAYIRSTWPDRIQQVQAARTQGEAAR
ncbi:c-type cytochrome [Profundibacterium mesophilum]|uniref:Alcohol dehydrogenase n=1 Tax=Profundibacterium mesophilum KAUST100406-0324 TaxID=1037889 RepID=A0A921NPT9_9RHOB|nr:cytochrome c [Profundibacterium mesophilum]KAF0675757.1 alcohol dehydrogenase [Profundibacterium mesophilum KAUST100406-0324]